MTNEGQEDRVGGGDTDDGPEFDVFGPIDPFGHEANGNNGAEIDDLPGVEVAAKYNRLIKSRFLTDWDELDDPDADHTSEGEGEGEGEGDATAALLAALAGDGNGEGEAGDQPSNGDGGGEGDKSDGDPAKGISLENRTTPEFTPMDAPFKLSAVGTCSPITLEGVRLDRANYTARRRYDTERKKVNLQVDGPTRPAEYKQSIPKQKEYAEIINRERAAVAAFRELVDAPPSMEGKISFNERRGNLDAGEVYRHKNSADIWESDSTSFKPRLQIVVMPDDSGSMSGSAIKNARVYTACIVEAMRDRAVQTIVFTINHDYLYDSTTSEDPSDCIRFGSTGGTNIGGAIDTVLPIMFAQPHNFDRRVIFVPTDGETSIDACVAAVDRARAMGVDVFGFATLGANPTSTLLAFGEGCAFNAGTPTDTLPMVATMINARLG